VSDVQGGSSNPVPGAQVQIEQLRGGSYVTVTRGQTDAGGVVSFSFTSRSNTIWRAVVRSSSGQTYSSRVRSTASVADVTWSGRPDDDVRHGTKVSYKVRVVPGQGATAAFQIATAARPNRWQTARRGTVPFTGVYSGSVVFPKAGTWRLRALSLPTGSNASGVSSTLTITVH
jgi:hypothetical protein